MDSSRKVYTFSYPCSSTHECHDFEFSITPGIYRFELYGASGDGFDGRISSYTISKNKCINHSIVELVHGNTECVIQNSRAGAGGYVAGTIKIYQTIKAYATIGGKGEFGHKIHGANSPDNYLIENRIRGGYGLGGSNSNSEWDGCGSGGGQTALKFIENDLWHRVIVSGGGGGSDNSYGTPFGEDDGSGGAGGGLTAQGYWVNGVYNDSRLANWTFGFTFGSGEAAQINSSKNTLYGVKNGVGWSDRSGSGGGCFGGFASHNGNGGSGGGSSWVLSRDAIIPQGDIDARDEFYDIIGSKPYAFDKKSGYLFSNVYHGAGVWSGNG